MLQKVKMIIRKLNVSSFVRQFNYFPRSPTPALLERTKLTGTPSGCVRPGAGLPGSPDPLLRSLGLGTRSTTQVEISRTPNLIFGEKFCLD